MPKTHWSLDLEEDYTSWPAEGARLCVVRAVGMRNLNLTRQLEWLSEPREQDYEGQLRSQHVPKRGVYRCCLTARA